MCAISAKLQNEIFETLKTNLDLFHTPTKVAYATITTDTEKEIVTVRSKALMLFVTNLLYTKSGKIPQQSDTKNMLNLLEFEAMKGPERQLHVRVAQVDGSIYIDLANKAGEQIKITNAGYEVIPANQSPVYFAKSPKIRSLPLPKRDGQIDKLFQFLNLENNDDAILVVAWLLMATNPNGPFPILCIQGEQGSGKSSLCKLLRNLIDPSWPAITSMPGSERDMLIAANNSLVLAYDNISAISSTLSDVQCRLSTGGGFSTRTLFTNDQETCFDLKRPILLNGISEVVTRHDLCDRAIFIKTSPIAPDKRRTEEEILAALETAKPEILGGLCKAISTALRNKDQIILKSYPRMADFAKWVVAAEAALPFPQGAFLAAYESNRQQIIEEAIYSDPIATAIATLTAKQETWSGTPSELLEVLNTFTTDEIKRTRQWPKMPNSLSGKLRRSATFLRERSIEVSFSKSGIRNITIFAKPNPQPPPAPAENGTSVSV